jgi:outer membrane protein TolC
MRRHPPKPALLLPVLALLLGCSAQQPFYFHQTGDLSRYIGLSQEIDIPDVCGETLSEVAGDQRPFSVGQNEPKQIWALRLEEAIRYALQNSKVMRSIGGQVQGPPEFLTQTLDLLPPGPGSPVTIYDPAITETDARTGVQAALSAFDAQWQTDVFWERNHEPQDALNLGLPQFFPTVLLQDTAQFQTQLTKTSASGTQFSLQHNLTYDLENTDRVLSGDWLANFQIEVRQPLLQGLGEEFNRIAGPNAIPGVNQGVVLARLNADITLADFERGVRNLVSDVETAYWELYFAYRNLDAAVAGRDSALATWQKTYALFKAGAAGGDKASEAQAREQYFFFRSTVEQGLNGLYTTESKLRYVMGLAATDGRLIRPSDDPTVAKVAFDWTQVHSEALSRSVEIRAAKWRVKHRELELISAKNWLLPRLDLVGRYQWLGMGANLIQEGGKNFGGAYENLFGNDFQDWHVELQFKMPIGFRKELSGVRNAELALARERAILQETELEVSHQLAYAIRDLDANLALIETNYNRRIAAERNVQAVTEAYQVGRVLIDVLLQAQRILAQADSDYYRSLASYNEAIMRIHYRKGSLLEYNGVYLAEGPWPGKAYFDARRRARAHGAAKSLDYGFTMPRVVSRGPYQQFGGAPLGPEGAAAAVPGQALTPELAPVPGPEANPLKPEAGSPQPATGLPKAAETQVGARPQATSPDWDVLGEHASSQEPFVPPCGGVEDPRRADARLSVVGQAAGSGPTRGPDLYEPLSNLPPAEADRPAPGGPGL